MNLLSGLLGLAVFFLYNRSYLRARSCLVNTIEDAEAGNFPMRVIK